MEMTKPTIEEALRLHDDLIVHLAKKYQKMFPWDWEFSDRKQFLYMKVVEIYPRYDPSKGELGKYLGYVLFQRLMSMNKKRYTLKTVPEDMTFSFSFYDNWNARDSVDDGSNFVDDIVLSDDRFVPRTDEQIALDQIIEQEQGRDRDILESIRRGEMLESIGQRYGVTRQAIQQTHKMIIKRIKIKHGEINGLKN